MKSNFSGCLDKTLTYEGGFVDNKKDPGGATNKGVTIGTLKRLNIDVDHDGDSDLADLKALAPTDLAFIYRSFYWNPVQGDLLPVGIDLVTFDAGVMSGVARGSRWTQLAAGMSVADADGSIGPKSLAAILSKNDVYAMINRACDLRLAFCQQARNSETGALLWPEFGNGWSIRIAKVRAAALAMH